MFRQIWNIREDLALGKLSTNHVDMTLITPPAIEPVTPVDVKRQARISFDNDDQLVAMYIEAARQRIEIYLRRALITQTWDFTADWGPAWLELPKAPLQSVTGIYTTNLANVEGMVDTAIYNVNTNTSLIALNIGEVWPLHRGKAGFRVRYVCGYGNTPSAVPAAIRLEIMTLAARMYDTRDQVELSPVSKGALRPYRIMGQPFRMAKGINREDLLA